MAGPSAALLRSTNPTAHLTDVADPSDLDRRAALLDDVGKLHRARIAHGALDGDHILVDPLVDRLVDLSGTTIVDFDQASVFAVASELDRDAAQAMVTTALCTSADRAAAHAAFGGQAGAPARTGIQVQRAPANAHGTDRVRYQAIELHCSTSSPPRWRHTDDELAQPVELRRVKPLNIVMLGALVFAVWVILGQIGSVSELVDTLKTADWPWLVVGFMLAVDGGGVRAQATIGSVRRSRSRSYLRLRCRWRSRSPTWWRLRQPPPPS